MSLSALARGEPQAEPLRVPDWTLGCFHRRCITYATGFEDTATRVIWIQSHGLTADLRLPVHRPEVSGRGGLAACTPAERAELARGEGFVARTSWDGELMRWDAFAAFQPYDKWPEPGRLERVGACLIEWAPSGVYVEDWRLQPGSSGLSVGLELISERGADGVERPRTGGLVIAGDHALMIIGRREELPSGRAQEQLAAEPDRWATTFDAEVAYAKRGAAGWIIELAVNPFAEGRTLFHEGEFEAADQPEILVQTSRDPSSPWRERLWKIDTLLAEQSRSHNTQAAKTALEWLAKEAGSLGLPSMTALV